MCIVQDQYLLNNLLNTQTHLLIVSKLLKSLILNYKIISNEAIWNIYRYSPY